MTFFVKPFPKAGAQDLHGTTEAQVISNTCLCDCQVLMLFVVIQVPGLNPKLKSLNQKATLPSNPYRTSVPWGPELRFFCGFSKTVPSRVL